MNIYLSPGFQCQSCWLVPPRVKRGLQTLRCTTHAINWLWTWHKSHSVVKRTTYNHQLSVISIGCNSKTSLTAKRNLLCICSPLQHWKHLKHLPLDQTICCGLLFCLLCFYECILIYNFSVIMITELHFWLDFSSVINWVVLTNIECL